MSRILVSSLLLLFFLLPHVDGQEEDVIISGDFRDLPFTEFAEQIKQQTEVTFYYLEEWVRGIRVTISGEKISL